MNLGTLGTLFVLTLYLQSVRGNSARVAGLAMLPLFAPLTVLAPYAGRLVGKVGPRRPMILGLALASAGLLGIATLGVDSAYPARAGRDAALGRRAGLLTPAVVAAAITAVPAGRAGLASAVNNTSRQAGGAIGIAVCGSIAGSPGASGFLPGLRAVGLGVAALWGVAIVATWLGVPDRPGG
jgi:DHA2 family methylenomycin A resistance protein-like MFS transporter